MKKMFNRYKTVFFTCVMAVAAAVMLCACHTDETADVPGKVTVNPQQQTGEDGTTAPAGTGGNAVADEDRGSGSIVYIYGEGDAERLGVSETLVWVAPYGNTDSQPLESAVGRLNELLVNEYGCDFVVEFHLYDGLMSVKTPWYTHYDMLVDMKELGQQADIIYSGNSNEYDSLISAGIYEPLTDYLATDEGKKLYDAYADEIWRQTARGGEIYGYTSKTYPAETAVLMGNTELAQKYGIEIPDSGWNFYDLGDMLEGVEIKDGVTVGEKVIPVAGVTKALLCLSGYYVDYSISDYILFKTDAETGLWQAVNPAAEDELIRLWKTIKDYHDRGWYMSADSGIPYKLSLKGNFIFSAGCYGNSKYTDGRLLLYDYSTCEVEAGDTAYVPGCPVFNMVTGVASWSEKKEDALKLITLIQTDAGLSNLLRFGIQGEDYEYRDGILAALPGRAEIVIPIYFADLSNINLTHSVYNEPEDKLAYSKEISGNFADGVGVLYDIDLSGYGDSLNRIGQIYTKYEEMLFDGTCADVDATVAAMREKYAAAGLDEVIGAINGQIREQAAGREE